MMLFKTLVPWCRLESVVSGKVRQDVVIRELRNEIAERGARETRLRVENALTSFGVGKFGEELRY